MKHIFLSLLVKGSLSHRATPDLDHPDTEPLYLLRSLHPRDTFSTPHAICVSPNEKVFSLILQQGEFSAWHQWAALPTLVVTN